MDNKTRVAVVSNIPAPYRLDVFRQFAGAEDLEVRVFYCSGREPNRDWDLGTLSFDHRFLKESFISWRGRYIHVNPDIWTQLRAFKPGIVLTTGFNPTHLVAYAYARMHRCAHVAMTDGTWQSESSSLSAVHRWIRRRVYAKTAAFIGACEGTFALYRHYGIADHQMFKSHLCANNAAFSRVQGERKIYDFVFCGRFAEVKNPVFALQVCQGVARRLGRPVSIALVGAGDQETAMRATVSDMGVDVQAHFLGFAKQAELPVHYAKSRVFLFPTTWDPWGVVANEACAAGVPTLVSPLAGAADELIQDGVNGRVLPLVLSEWVDAAVALLSNDTLWQQMSRAAVDSVAEYTYTHAAQGMLAAVRMAAGRPMSPLNPMILPWSQRPAMPNGSCRDVHQVSRERSATVEAHS